VNKLPANHPLLDPISGDAFLALAGSQWKNDGRNGRERPPASGIVFCKTEDAIPFMRLLNKTRPSESYLLISHNSDLCASLDDKEMARTWHLRRPESGEFCEMPPQIKKWYAVNGIRDDWNTRFQTIPLGVCNKAWGAGDVNEWARVAASPRGNVNRVLCCFSVPTNPPERQAARAYFEGKPWATVAGGKTELDLAPQDFMRAMRDHDYIPCPVGNGPDCHRWIEAILVGSVPAILASNPMLDFYGELCDGGYGTPMPYTVVPNWEGVEVVKDLKKTVSPCLYPKLSMAYWRRTIMDEGMRL
jgi:hypothetical protein